jgi:hypothetical protein
VAQYVFGRARAGTGRRFGDIRDVRCGGGKGDGRKWIRILCVD